MTLDQLKENMIRYYGEPNRESLIKATIGYIEKYINQDKLKELWRCLRETHSATTLNNPFPSVKEIVGANKWSREEYKTCLLKGTTESAEVERINNHKKEIESLPESERIEIENEGDLLRKLLNDVENTNNTLNNC